MNIEEAADLYRRTKEDYEKSSQKIAAELRSILDEQNIAARVEGRSKSYDGFVKKAIRKPRTHIFDDITDKAAARANILLERDMLAALEALRMAWGERLIGEVQDLGQRHSATEFGYTAFHLQVRTNEVDSAGNDIQCEVQLRTAAHDVWADIDHRYQYKNPLMHVPSGVARSLARLAALVETFDREVEATVREVETAPYFPEARFVAIAETAFRNFNTARFDRALSLQIVSTLRDILPSPDDYESVLDKFVQDNRVDLTALFEGASGLETDPRYVLLSQPEILIVLQLAVAARLRLSSALKATDSADLRYFFEPVAAAFGHPLPDT